MRFTVDTEHPVTIPVGEVNLDGLLHIPKDACGLVLFVHGSGSSRLSVRNQHVARVLNNARLATLLFDLLTPEEEVIDDQTRALRFDIPFLAGRLQGVTRWCLHQLVTHEFNIGYFGASTGGGAALLAAAAMSDSIKAVVSRGGRPDLAGEALARVIAPTLLIVGGDDLPVIKMNEDAMRQMKCLTRLEIVPGASHLFEEPGTLDQVAVLAKSWFLNYLSAA